MVHYVNEQGVELAALIVHVWSEQTINLYYFPNGVEIGGVAMKIHEVDFSERKTPNSWHWPEYVPDTE